jgi:hypothetical protein
LKEFYLFYFTIQALTPDFKITKISYMKVRFDQLNSLFKLWPSNLFIKAAREVHQLVDTISSEVENKIGQSISMQTDINTGLVVNGEVNMARCTHGVAGGTINIASRLSNLAKPGEIVVDVDTCHQVEGHFACEYMETTA